jgi:hypothetical protein
MYVRSHNLSDYRQMEKTVVSALARSAGRSFTSPLTNSAIRGCASGALPPLPATNNPWPALSDFAVPVPHPRGLHAVRHLSLHSLVLTLSAVIDPQRYPAFVSAFLSIPEHLPDLSQCKRFRVRGVCFPLRLIISVRFLKFLAISFKVVIAPELSG